MDQVGPDDRAAAWHQLSVLIDDHPLPTHDELAWRAAVRAYRLDPAADLYRGEALRRTFFRSPYAQLPRSAGNMFLYGALVVREAGKRTPPLLVLAWPLSLLLVAPGVLCHAVSASGVRLFRALFSGRVAADLRGRPADEALLVDVRATLEQADAPQARGDAVEPLDDEAPDP